MPYEEEKDKVIKDYGEIEEGSGLFAQLRSYQDGPVKLFVFQKVGKNKDKIKKVLRVPFSEALVISTWVTSEAHSE